MHAARRHLLAFIGAGLLLALPRAYANVSCEPLKVFFEDTTGIYWMNKTGWLSTSNCCTWHGIKCVAGEISEIKLAYNGLAGTLSPELAMLPFLNGIVLDHNSISGTVWIILFACRTCARVMRAFRARYMNNCICMYVRDCIYMPLLLFIRF